MTRLRSVSAALLIAVAVFLVTHVLSFPGSVAYLADMTEGRRILDQQASFSSEETYRRLEEFGATGRKMYLRTLVTVDIVFPLSMFVVFFLWSKYAAERIGMAPSLRLALRGLPIAYLTLDFLENVSIAAMLSRFPGRLEFLAASIGYLTQGKRIAMIGAVFLPGILLVVARTKLFFRQRRPVTPSS